MNTPSRSLDSTQTPQDSQSSENPPIIDTEALRAAGYDENTIRQYVVNTGAHFAMEQLRHPSRRQEAIFEIWDNLDAKQQKDLLSGSVTLNFLLELMCGPYATYKGIKRIQYLWNSWNGKIPQSTQDIMKEEMKAYVAIGVLKPKDPKVYDIVDTDGVIAGRFARGITRAMKLARIDQDAIEIVDNVAKILDSAGEYVKITLPEIREKVAQANIVSSTRKTVHDKVEKTLNAH